jgi:guanylate kinase
MSSDLIKPISRGRLFIVSAPAGTGKTTLVNRLTDEFSNIIHSISYTSRAPRPGDIPGVSYHFISDQEFEKKIADGEFLEYVKLYDQYYGTSRKWVEEQLNQGKHVVLVIDTEGALFLKNKVSATYIFIQPPSFNELERRLINRKTEDAEAVKQRLAIAAKEIERSKQYDYLIINDKFETAYQVLRSIFIAETHKINC